MPSDAIVDGATSTNPTGAQPATLLEGQSPANPANPASSPNPADPAAKPAEGTEPKAGEKKEGEGPPDEYKMPEGVTLDEAAATEFSVLAKDMGLSQEQAQKLVSLYAANQVKAADAYADQITKWGEETKSDPEIGGDKLAENLAIAKRAVDLTTPEFRQILTTSGYGNHPAFIKGMIAIGKALSPDTVAKGDKAGNVGTKDPSKVLFPNMN